MSDTEYYKNQIETLTEGGAYGYAIQIRCNANNDKTTWMNITEQQLQQIKAVLTGKLDSYIQSIVDAENL